MNATDVPLPRGWLPYYRPELILNSNEMCTPKYIGWPYLHRMQIRAALPVVNAIGNRGG